MGRAAAVGVTEAVAGREAVEVVLAAAAGRAADVAAEGGRVAEVVVVVAAVAGRAADAEDEEAGVAELAVVVGFMEEVASFLGWDV